MSEYDYDDRPRRRSERRTRDRSPEYVTETTYIQRGQGQPSRDLIYRPRDREDSIEDIPRDFPPGTEYRRTKYRDEYAPPRRARSDHRGRGYDDYDDRYSDYGAPSGGAAAGYAASRARRGGRDRDYDDGYHTDSYDRRPMKERRKSKIEETLEDFGLGGIAGGLIGKARSKSRSRRHRDSSSDSGRSNRSTRSRRNRSGSNSRETRKKWQQAAQAAVITAAVEGFRSRKEPGPWTGPKGQRIATAALGAAGIDGFVDKDPDDKSKRHVLQSVIGGLAAARLANGPRERSGSRGRSQSRSRSRGPAGLVDRVRSRSRSVFGRGRSQSRGREDGGGGNGLKDVAAIGGVAAVGKAIYDRVRSKSRKRRSPSASSEDSFVPSRRQRYRGGDRGPPSEDGYDDDRVARPRGREEGGGGGAERKRDGSASSVSTTDLENRRKKTRGKELLTAGLATVATIHAAHGVYSSMVASEGRHKLVMEGEMSPEEARKRKSKNMLQDVAAVGIAALGIKSAFGEWKEMNEQRSSLHELETRRRKRKKEKEKREKEMRMNPFGGMQANPYLTYPAPMPMYPPGPTAYADGNPYGAVSNVPPPPMGAPPQRY